FFVVSIHCASLPDAFLRPQEAWIFQMSERYELVLTCPKSLESLLLEEATGLGLQEAREHVAMVRGYAGLETAYRLCLWSRLANRVLLVLARFPVDSADSLYEGVKAVDWSEHLRSEEHTSELQSRENLVCRL